MNYFSHLALASCKFQTLHIQKVCIYDLHSTKTYKLVVGWLLFKYNTRTMSNLCKIEAA